MALPVVVVLLFSFASCEKALDDISETSTSAEDIAAAETAISSAFDVMDDVSSTDGRVLKNGSSLLPNGAQVVFTDSSFTDGNGVAFYIDFGPYNENAPVNGLLCPDGKFRAGRVEISVSSPYSQIGCVATANFPNSNAYYVGTGSIMNKVLGTMTATRSASETVKLEIVNAQVITPEGTVTLSSSKEITRTVGSGDIGTLGDEFEITGNGSGINRDNEPFTIEITKTLVKRVEDGCANTFIIGKIELKNDGASSAMMIDFDPDNNGACDNKAEITLPGGIKKEIQIK